MRLTNLLKNAAIGGVLLSMVGCSSVGFMSLGAKGNLSDYKLRKVPVEEIGSGMIQEGVSVSAMERDPSDSLYGKRPHFYVGIRAVGNTSSKIVIFDGDNGKPIEAYVVEDR